MLLTLNEFQVDQNKLRLQIPALIVLRNGLNITTYEIC